MKKTISVLCLFILTAVACDLTVTVAPSTVAAPPAAYTNIASVASATPVPASATTSPSTPTPTPIPASVTPLPATVAPSVTATNQEAASDGVRVAAGPVSIVLPAGLAGSGRGSQIPRTEGQELAYWEQAPGHTVLELEGYLLQGKANAPRVYVYPAMEYAQMVAGAFESIHRLDNILYGPRAPISPDQLPAVPFFNGKPAFSAQIQTVSFQNGSGVRFLTEYAEYAVSGNNQDLFYHFEGLTRDGTYYIVAILPISHPKLAETSDGGAALPPGGIPYPYFADPQTDMRGYYREVTTLLDDALPGDFSPSIEQLDQLILSMRVIP